jgi:hypothetical protein
MPGLSTRENVVDLAAIRAGRGLSSLPAALEMDWEKREAGGWSLARTVWFAVIVSTALWAVIAGAIWLI